MSNGGLTFEKRVWVMMKFFESIGPHKSAEFCVHLNEFQRLYKEKTLEDFKPTPEAINNLPESLRKYIHDLETICDPAGMVQEIASLKEQRDALVVRVKELEK